jgi:hypothetical protein
MKRKQNNLESDSKDFRENKVEKKQKVASSWLSNFLSQKREIETCVPPDSELANDAYLREFSMQFKFIDTSVGVSDNSDVDDDQFDAPVDIEISVAVRDASLVVSAVEGEGEEEEREEEGAEVTNGKLKLFNLPFKIKEREVRERVSAAYYSIFMT